MLRSYIFRASQKLLRRKSNSACFRRMILSAAYACQEAWDGRKHEPVLASQEPYVFIADVKQKIVERGILAAVDIDIATHLANSSHHASDLRWLIDRLRHSPQSVDTLESTHHAIVKYCLEHSTTELLMELLSDSINYGIFPDPHAANLAMDHFLESGNSRDAVHVAWSVMKQEDYSNQLCCGLSILACIRWLKDPTPEPWNPFAKESTEEIDEDDQIIFRFPYLKNPHFDGHFDLEDPHSVIGRMLQMSPSHLPSQFGDSLIHSIKLYGLICSGAVQEAIDVIDRCITESIPLYEDVLNASSSAVEQTVVDSEKPSDGAGTSEDASTDSTKDENISLLAESCEKFRREGNIIKQALDEAFTKVLESVRPRLEEEDIAAQQNLYKRWAEVRSVCIDDEIQWYLKKERLKQIGEERKKLAEREEWLFFFENREEIDKRVEIAESLRQKEQAKRKGSGKRPDATADRSDVYVLPEIGKRAVEKQKDIPDWLLG